MIVLTKDTYPTIYTHILLNVIGKGLLLNFSGR